MTATVDIITKTKNSILAVPISAVVVKSDTSAVSDVKVLEPSDDKIKHLKATRNSSVFCESGDKAKIRVIKTGIQDDTNIEVKTGLKKVT
jgi:HlyD family secretion protein